MVVTTLGTTLDEASVLVVEDDRDLAALYTVWLADTNTLQTATNGRETLELLDSGIDVVLLDRQLPTLSGEELLEIIRERDLPCRVIMASGVEPDFDLLDMEFDGYLVKPVTRDEVRTAVRRMLTEAMCDEKLREFRALSKKRTLLEERTTGYDRETNAEYAELETRLAEAGEQFDASVDAVGGVTETTDSTNIDDEHEPSSLAGFADGS